MVKAILAARSSFSREYSRLADDGERTSMAMVPKSDDGRKLKPPSLACNASAPANTSTASTAIALRWCSAQAMTLP